MEQTLNETLLEDVKSRLRITWNDEDKQLIKQLNEERRIYKNFVVRLFLKKKIKLSNYLLNDVDMSITTVLRILKRISAENCSV